ncbi:MAG: hypothetical protein LBO82_00910 [Synergistaceae bacterium]|nr:hypothetical protein [Synergistaceae bacterium]
MSKTRRILAALLFLTAFLSSSAWALEPQNALSARPEESFYVTLRVDDLSGIFRKILSPANIELLASFASPSEAQGVRLIGSYASRIPAKSVAFVAGSTAEAPFLQIAASMPKELQSKLDLIAEGKAAESDLTALVLGDDSPLFSSVIDVEVRQGKHGPYYAVRDDENPFALSAKGDLLLISLFSADLDASKEALENADKRLAFKRRFKNPNYCAFHIDMPTAHKVAEESGNSDETKAVLEYFKAPLNFELDLDSKPGSFLISCAINALESIVTAKDFEKLTPPAGGGIFPAGAGKPYFGFGGLTNFNPKKLEAFPEASEAWKFLTEKMKKEGISPEDLENLLSGSISLVSSGRARFLDQTIPGFSFAVTGRKGAAGRLLKQLLENEKFAASVPLSPLKAQEGWDMLFQVDPAVLPSSFLVGVKGETLFLGILNSGDINKKADFSPQTEELLGKESFATAFIDVPALWDYLRLAILDDKSSFAREIGRSYPFVTDILDGELPFGLIELWAPTLETSFLEVRTVDVAPEKNLLSKLAAAAKTAFSSDTKQDAGGESPLDSETQPLLLLMVAKGAVEEALEEDPGADLDDLREDFSDFAVILKTKSGEIYVGTQVSGEEKALLREQAEDFGLLGSAGLGLAPDGTPYSGQEAVWLKVETQ